MMHSPHYSFSPEIFRLSHFILVNSLSFISLQWHHSLAVLDVSSNSGINDQSLELFRNFGMPKMQTLDLSSTNVTGEGVRYVQGASLI